MEVDNPRRGNGDHISNLLQVWGRIFLQHLMRYIISLSHVTIYWAGLTAHSCVCSPLPNNGARQMGILKVHSSHFLIMLRAILSLTSTLWRGSSCQGPSY
jgi:hypothetical protein